MIIPALALRRLAQKRTQVREHCLLPAVLQLVNCVAQRVGVRPETHDAGESRQGGRAGGAAVLAYRNIWAYRRPAARAVPHRHQRKQTHVARVAHPAGGDVACTAAGAYFRQQQVCKPAEDKPHRPKEAHSDHRLSPG